jgi:hypothetical protein
MKRISDSSDQVQQFIAGQVWLVREKLLQISRVGKLLIHHRFIKKGTSRVSSESFHTPAELSRMLKTNKAVLLPHV